MKKFKISIVTLIILTTIGVLIFLMFKANEIQQYVMAYYPKPNKENNASIYIYFQRLLNAYLGVVVK